MNAPSSLWLPVTLMLVSAASMALEIVAGRALAPYVGMSLYTWTVIIAIVLAGLSLGHWIGGAMGDRTSRPARWAAAALTGAALSSGASLVLLRLVDPLAATANPVGHAGLLAVTGFFLPSVLAGVLAPLLTKMALDVARPDRHGRVLGQMFALGAFGAILGTLASGLVLISFMGTAGSVLVITLIYAGLALVFWRWRARVIVAAGFAVLAGAAALSPIGALMAAPCARESAYFCIRLDDTRFMGRAGRVLALDHLAHGINDRDDPRLLLTPYVQGIDEIAGVRLPDGIRSAYFIGGGAFSLPRAWAARYPDARLVVAEIDPAVTQVASDRLWLPDGIEIRPRDARVALARMPEGTRFDVIFGDAFHDISIPPHLVTDEFHALVARRLTERGFYAMNVVDRLREPRFVLSLARTLAERFSHVELWLDLEQVRPGERRTTWIVIAGAKPTDAAEIRAEYGFARRWVQVPLDAMIREVGEDRLVRLTDDHAPIDRLLGDLLLDADLTE